MFWKNKKAERVIEYRMPTEVEQMQIERRNRAMARMERLRKAHDAKIWVQIREVEASIAPQLQEIQNLKKQLRSINTYDLGQMALLQQAAQMPNLFSPLACLGALLGNSIGARIA